MESQGIIARVDGNRGLRDRLGRNRADEISIRRAAALEIAVHDLQGLVRSRFADPRTDPWGERGDRTPASRSVSL